MPWHIPGGAAWRPGSVEELLEPRPVLSQEQRHREIGHKAHFYGPGPGLRRNPYRAGRHIAGVAMYAGEWYP